MRLHCRFAENRRVMEKRPSKLPLPACETVCVWVMSLPVEKLLACTVESRLIPPPAGEMAEWLKAAVC